MQRANTIHIHTQKDDIAMSSGQLSPEQAHALFDILTHHQIYSEIEGFKSPEAIRNYGPPFTQRDPEQLSSPLLQLMFNGFVVKLPGMSILPPEFWQERLETLVTHLGEAELSESYDKGSMGTRKTLSTASSVLLEAAARGCLGGCPKPARDEAEKKEYDLSNAEDLQAAWETAAHKLVYGDLIDELYDATAESDKLEDKSPMVQAVVEHAILRSVTDL